MKKLHLLLMVLLLAAGTAFANHPEIKVSQLPMASQNFMASHFADATINKMMFLKREGVYKVCFSNNKCILFDKSGEWISVDCHDDAVPLLMIPVEVQNKVAKSYGPGTRITSIKKARKHMDIHLSNVAL